MYHRHKLFDLIYGIHVELSAGFVSGHQMYCPVSKGVDLADLDLLHIFCRHTELQNGIIIPKSCRCFQLAQYAGDDVFVAFHTLEDSNL
jgi:hypothetical protein